MAGLNAAQNILAALEAIGLSASAQRFSLILPLGISFFTLQAIGCAVDVTGKNALCRKARCISACSQAFSALSPPGPSRGRAAFCRSFRRRAAFDADKAVSGLVLMAQGLLAKVCVADLLAVIANGVWGDVRAYSGPVLALGALAYTFQLYFDFSGYSMLAQGCARVLGLELPQNFNTPYFSRSIKEFWRRWHMSLSAWLRDYVYIPPGEVTGRARRASISTFWPPSPCPACGTARASPSSSGAFCTGCIRWRAPCWSPRAQKAYALLHIRRSGRLASVWQCLFTFLLVHTAWVFFRAASVQDALYVLTAQFAGGAPGGHWRRCGILFWPASMQSLC